MTSARLQELIDAHLEGRLSEGEAAELSAELAGSPDACRLFWECAHTHALLGELMAEAAGRRMAVEVPGPRRRVAGWLAVAASLLVAAWAWWMLAPSPRGDDPFPIVLSEMHGEVHVLLGQTLRLALRGQALLPGAEIRTGEDGSAVVSYADSSRLRLGPDTSVRLLEEESQGVYFVKGEVKARVAPQPTGKTMVVRTEQGDLLAAGTRFSWATLLGESRIEMEEGQATLNTPGSTRGIELLTGSFALISAPNAELYQPAPMLPASGKPTAIIDEPSGPVMALAASPDGRMLAIPAGNGQVRLWDTRKKRFTRTLSTGEGRVPALAYSPDGKMLAVGHEAKKKGLPGIAVFDAGQGAIVHCLATRVPLALAWLPDGRSLAFGIADKHRPGVFVWDLGDSRERLAMGESDRIGALAVSPDGTTAAAGCRDGRVVLHDLTTGRPVRTLRGHLRDVQAAAYQPGGPLLATGSRDGTVRLWDGGTGDLVRVLSGKFGEVRCLAFSPDGRTLASGHGGLVVLWDVEAGRQRASMKAHQFAVTALAYLPGGRTLATAGWDRTVKLWPLEPAR